MREVNGGRVPRQAQIVASYIPRKDKMAAHNWAHQPHLQFQPSSHFSSIPGISNCRSRREGVVTQRVPDGARGLHLGKASPTLYLR